MTGPIEPIRRIQRPGRAERAADPVRESEDAAAEAPAADGPAPARPIGGADPAAAYTAQVIGQERRRHRGGPAILDAAKSAYNRVEWSGRADRRAPKGGLTKTDV